MVLLFLAACTPPPDTGTKDSATESAAPPVDADGDGYDASIDCDDGDAAVNPVGVEVCNGKDDDCDGVTDPASSADARTWFADADADTYGDPSYSQKACDAPAGWVADDTDCADGDATVFPGATERCNGKDDDCDGATDPDTAVDVGAWYADDDGDGFGAGDALLACDAPLGTVESATDCDDTDALVHPGGTERCNGEDDDCDGDVDPDTAEGVRDWYTDADSDGFGAGSAIPACDAPAGTVEVDGDCDDGRADISPDATEVCNGDDDDCDGVIDPDSSAGTSVWYADDDADGHGDPSATTIACDAPPGWLATADDCDDTRADVSPDGAEVCDAADADEDCDTLVDDADPDVGGLLDVYVDGDGDGSPGTPTRACDGPTTAADCDDTDIRVFPGATETCDGRDEDCNGTIDDGPGDTVYHPDADGDGYGVATGVVTACAAPAGYVEDVSDCDDTDAAIHPGAVELCWDSVDQDCDGSYTTDRDCAPVGSVSGDLVVYGDTANEHLGVALAAWGDTLAIATGTGMVEGVNVLADTTTFTLTGTSGFGTSLGYADGALLVGATDALYVYADPASGVSSATWTGATSAIAVGDGVLIGAATFDRFGATDAGGAYLLHDVAGGGDLADADVIFRGEQPGDAAGTFVAMLGDTDGDGVDDYAIGGPENDRGGDGAGRVWIIPGPVSGIVDLAGERTSVMGAAGDSLGPVAGAGDVDADGYADVLIGAPDADPGSKSGAGKALLFAGPVSPGAHLAADAAAEIDGAATSAAVGQAVAGAGDVDADGYADLWIGATGSSAAYLYYGPVAGTLTTATADATVTGSSGSALGAPVLGGADFDADGFADLAVGAEDASLSTVSKVGQVKVVLGGSRGEAVVTPAVPDPADDADGDGYTEAGGDCDDTRATRAPGLTEVCANALDEDCDGQDDPCAPTGALELVTARLAAWIGTTTSTTDTLSIQPAGDVNGDGWPDLITSSSRNGSACVMLGPIAAGSRSWEYGDVCYTQEASGDGVATAIAGVGDFNGDGFDDVAIGAESNDTNGSAAGRLYVIFGSADPVGGSLADADLILSGAVAGDAVGGGVVGVGDQDGDGRDDLVFSASPEEPGRLFLLLGQDGGDLGLADADAWIAAELDSTHFGSPFDRAGDLDGDGVEELIIGADYLGGRGESSGAAYILWGGLTTTGQDVRYDATTIEGSACSSVCEHAGRGIAAGGDVNGDGYGDLLVGAWAADSGKGAVYLFYGPIPRGDLRVDEADATFTGGSGYAGYAVDDTSDLDHDGYDDVVIGAYGYDGSSYGSDAGRVNIFYGPVAPGDHLVTAADATLTGASYGGAGRQLRGGVDLDLDGYEDLLVGAYKAGYSGSGETRLVLGGRRLGTWTEPAVVDPDADRDGDGWSITGGDCDDTDATTFPGGTEVCEDAADGDCDGFDPPCFPTGSVDIRDYNKVDAQRFSTHYYWGATLTGVEDLDGDGRDELLIGDRDGAGTISSSGVALLYQGPLPRGEWDADDRWPETSFDGEAYNDGVGYAMADLGDVDADGLRDLAIGAADNDYSGTTAGSVYLILGAELGAGHVDLTRADARLYSPTASTSFGTGVCGPGDVDGDGLDDVIVGAAGDDAVATDAGAVYVFYGGAFGGARSSADADLVFTGEATLDAAGPCAAAGDTDGDGRPDLLMAAAGNNTGGAKGRVYLWFGAAEAGTVPIADVDVVVSGTTGLTAAMLGAGDTDHDGRADVLLSASGDDTAASNAGAVYWWTGAPAAGAWDSDADAIFLGAAKNDELGGALAWGDFDADGSHDLLLGAPHSTGTSPIDGAIYVYWGGAGWTGTSSVASADVILNGDSLGYWHAGTALASGIDLNGDGFDDIAETTGDDSVIVVYGGMR